MTAQAPASPQKSTTVRSQLWTLEALRFALRTTALVAPSATDRMTTAMFFRPRRARRVQPPEVAGLTAQRLWIESSFGRLAAWSWGTGPTVLFAHGWEGHAGQFAWFIAPLVLAGYRAVTFDMPAHGRSEGRSVSVVDMAQAIREVAEDTMPFRGVDHEPLHAIVAHSLGGAATVLALHDGLRTRSAVLLAPVAEPTPFAMRAAQTLRLSRERTNGLLQGIRETVGRDFHALDARQLAKGLRIPALVLHDRTDREVPFEHGEGIARSWPGARLTELQGLGHRRLLRDPDVTDQAVRFVLEREMPVLHAV